MFVYNFADPDLRIEIFFEKKEGLRIRVVLILK